METPGLADKVAFLRRPQSYPSQPHHVEATETHMSWVFLTDRHAYKLKKPIQYDYLDFSTLEARRRDCAEEVRLNRRLAADVYLGMVPLTLDCHGNIQLSGNGETIDWLVKMRRLPANRMLDYAISRGAVHETEVRKVGLLLARFYMQAPPVAMTPAAYRRRLASDVQTTRCELVKPIYRLPAGLVTSIAAAELELLRQQPELFDRRVQAGKIIEAHGDLRPEHICLEATPVIIDCLEFNRDFRILDTVSELAFLALECDRLGAPHVGEWLLETYREATGDTPPARLLTFYKCYHACMRSKVAVWHLKDAHLSDPATWISRARHYLHLADRLMRVNGYGETT